MMRAAAMAVGVLVLLCGCTGGGGSDEPSAETVTRSATSDTSEEAWKPASPEATTSTPPTERIQRILDAARFTEAQLGLSVNEHYQRESGLETPTASFCGDEADPADEQRIARSQRWWMNDEWIDHDAGGYTVGVEVVAYRPGGARDTMAVFEAVPRTCPSVSYQSGAHVTAEPGSTPTGLPGDAVTLRDHWTYPDGNEAPGIMVAIPAGDVIGFLYIRGDREKVDERVGELARTLAANVAEADAAIRALE
ncbi:hypothetical protein [Phytoactinopolyspora halotolerans]|uniref:Sensor domain-containing protein n=1 Tax=Phytoactinopolyspora halotolerans TaxID=1981512 RepID=A0A6L9SBZ0_9ACTN|nr:hypothetical protein [Phytoactinopolyspora halotolerans]NEE02184.1 hypothetical protein [Phytoactinopolyspora halotolerans]